MPDLRSLRQWMVQLGLAAPEAEVEAEQDRPEIRQRREPAPSPGGRKPPPGEQPMPMSDGRDAWNVVRDFENGVPGTAPDDFDRADQVWWTVAATALEARRRTYVYGEDTALRAQTKKLFRRKLPWQPEQIAELIRRYNSVDRVSRWQLPLKPMVSLTEKAWQEPPQGADRELLVRFARAIGEDDSTENTRLAARIEALLAPREPESEAEVSFEADAFGTAVAPWFAALGPADRSAWSALLKHAQAAGKPSKPSKRWMKQAAPLVDAVGVGAVLDRLVSWAPDLPMGPPDGQGFSQRVDPGLHPANTDRLKGLVWAVSDRTEPRLPGLFGRLAERCFKKIPDVGAGNTRLGNAALVALTRLPHNAGVAELTRLSVRVKYPSARTRIASLLDQAADAAGLSREDLEELAVPDFGLRAGRREIPIGPGAALITVDGPSEVSLRWRREDGKELKSIPKALKDADPAGVKAAKRLRKEILTALKGQAARLERYLLTERSWSIVQWRHRYGEHPLVAPVARTLVWRVGDRLGMYDGTWSDAGGGTFDPGTADTVSLWHPMDSEVDEVLAWRDRLESLGLAQPFKQAWREVYVLTPAELETRDYSNRFAAHLVRQHPLKALCHERGWRFSFVGQWDSLNDPDRPLPDGHRAEFMVEPVEGDTTANGVYTVLATDQVRFLDPNGVPMDLDTVPPRWFSETMRDVDLFVAVCSVGADEGWRDRGPHAVRTYWDAYIFGELGAVAKTRKAALERLVPRLAIADRCRLEDRWLYVQGTRSAYRIHLGSGNIQVLPGNRYLCIVPGRDDGPRKLYLPFDGDRTLSIILSKAFLLANDAEITDRSILAQLP